MKKFGGDDVLVGHTVSIAIGKGDDLVRVHVGHVQDLVVVEGHETWTSESRRKEADGETFRYVQAESDGNLVGQLLRNLHRHRLEAEVHRRSQGAGGIALVLGAGAAQHRNHRDETAESSRENGLHWNSLLLESAAQRPTPSSNHPQR